MKPACALALAALVLWPGPAAADEPAFEFVVAGHLKKLDPKKNSVSARLVALAWIKGHCPRHAKVRPSVLLALQVCLDNDPDAKVRQEAAQGLTVMAMHHQPPVCPLALVRALLDPDADVRAVATLGAGNFKKFDPAAFVVLQRCAQAEDPQIRRSATEILSCYGKDDKALGLIRALTRDQHFWVRDGAHWALFRVTARLDDIVPYCVRMRMEARPQKPFDPKAPEAELNERARKNLIMHSSWVYLYRLTAEFTEEMAKLLNELARDRSPVVREGVADFLAAFAERVANLRKPKKDKTHALIDDLEGRFNVSKPFDPPRETLDQAAVRLTKVAARLGELKVEATLRQLRDRDPEASVRAAAAEALKKFAAVRGKLP